MDISQAATYALVVAGAITVVTMWVNNIASAIESVADSNRATTERKVSAYDARTRMLGEQYRLQLERENRSRTWSKVERDAGLAPSANELLGKLDAQGRR